MIQSIPIYQVDAFANHVFSGNPAAVCMTNQPLPDKIMQQIAAENNLAETAFVEPNGDRFSIRWFTPTVEVDLCGHATLASAFILFFVKSYPGDRIRFDSRSGPLFVSRKDELLILDFPVDTLEPAPCPELLPQALGVPVLECYKGSSDYLALVDSEKTLVGIRPDFRLLSTLSGRGVIVTAAGESHDFVSRCFFPQSGIDEDPVTGSAHTSLVPYWSQKLGKTRFIAAQRSSRGGTLYCNLEGERVHIGGYARLYMEGLILIDLQDVQEGN